MAEFSLTALKDEIVNDPQALGYKNSAAQDDWKLDQTIADLINDPANGATIFRTNVPMSDVLGEIDWDGDWLNLSGQRNEVEDKKEAFKILTAGEFIDADSVHIRQAFAKIFESGTGGTLSRLNALVQKQGSRAEVLWGDGKVVTPGEVGRAFLLVGS